MTTTTTTTTSATVSAPKHTRRDTYEARVAEFIASNGPTFELQQVTYLDGEGMTCECCGKRHIHALYHVRSVETGTSFVIGCECQLLVLGTNAHLTAKAIRQLSSENLLVVGAKLGLSFVTGLDKGEMVAAILKARRHLANARAWILRKANKVASAPVQLSIVPVVE